LRLHALWFSDRNEYLFNTHYILTIYFYCTLVAFNKVDGKESSYNTQVNRIARSGIRKRHLALSFSSLGSVGGRRHTEFLCFGHGRFVGLRTARR
jgi:hypothetical protein